MAAIGLAFEQGTDVLRESPMLAVVEPLIGRGRTVRRCDEHLAVQKRVGAHRQFALDAIAHLADCWATTCNRRCATARSSPSFIA